MKKSTALLICLALLLVMCSCGNGSLAPVSTIEPTAEPLASNEECDEIAQIIKAVCRDDVKVSVFCTEEGMDVYVKLDPIILNYQFAEVLDDALSITKKALEERSLPLKRFSVIGVYYENGEESTSISWISDDFETGAFYAGKDKDFISNATVERIFEYCDYS